MLNWGVLYLWVRCLLLLLKLYVASPPPLPTPPLVWTNQRNRRFVWSIFYTLLFGLFPFLSGYRVFNLKTGQGYMSYTNQWCLVFGLYSGKMIHFYWTDSETLLFQYALNLYVLDGVLLSYSMNAWQTIPIADLHFGEFISFFLKENWSNCFTGYYGLFVLFWCVWRLFSSWIYSTQKIWM